MREPVLPRGTMVGRYRVDSLLREEPGVRLYAASGPDAAHPVTLAVLGAEGSGALEQLEERAERLRGLRHPGVVSVFDVGRHGDELFLARERTPGVNLRWLLEHGRRLETVRAIAVLGQVAGALGDLRRHGLGDGDLSTRNVLIDETADDPRAWVVDLGLTPEPAAIAPELREGGERDDRSDVYSLGALLLSEVTGTPETADVHSLLRDSSPSLPAVLRRVMARALDDDPAKRYETPGELLGAVRRSADPSIQVPITGPVSGVVVGSDVRQAQISPSPPPPLPPEPGATAADDPPRSAYALLDAPDTVVGGESVTVRIGLSDVPDPRLAGEPRLRRPPSSQGPYTLSIHVVAPDFELAPGASWRNELRVTTADPYPEETLELIAKDPGESWRATTIQATYSIDGQTMGLAVRPVGIARSVDLLDEIEELEDASTTEVSSSQEWTPPDLTVNVLRGSTDNTLSWVYVAHPRHGLTLPEEAEESSLGNDPATFAKNVIGEMSNQDADGLAEALTGIGRRIARKMPPGFWRLLREAAAAAGGPPTVLINSFDPYVPWELAYVDAPLIDPHAPPMLGAQADVGRWIPGDGAPETPPPPSDPSRSMSVISGTYDGPTLQDLKAAKEEAEDLKTAYGADPVDATKGLVLKCLRSAPDILHFAMHARGEVGGLRNGLLMVKGGVLKPIEIEGLTFPSAPFVFLNACEAGKGDELLGEYAGLAAAFMRAGAAGVVAPLWKINDGLAKELALRFYARVFDPASEDGLSVAAQLRAERSALGGEAPTATPIAYLFYGHPTMRLRAVPRGKTDG